MKRQRRGGVPRILPLAAVVLTAGALARELRKPANRRTWQGEVLGVPYDFRLPTPTRVRAKLWNPNSRRLLMPNLFGVGWSVNLARLARMARR
jgi:Family of unknown function (DUF5808)